MIIQTMEWNYILPLSSPCSTISMLHCSSTSFPCSIKMVIVFLSVSNALALFKEYCNFTHFP